MRQQVLLINFWSVEPVVSFFLVFWRWRLRLFLSNSLISHQKIVLKKTASKFTHSMPRIWYEAAGSADQFLISGACCLFFLVFWRWRLRRFLSNSLISHQKIVLKKTAGKVKREGKNKNGLFTGKVKGKKGLFKPGKVKEKQGVI